MIGLAAFFFMDESEISGIDHDAGGLSEDTNDVHAPDEVGEEADASDETEPPKYFGYGGDTRFFGDDPLDEHAPEERGLSDESDDDPPEGAPGGDVEETKQVSFKRGTLVPLVDLLGNECVEFDRCEKLIRSEI